MNYADHRSVLGLMGALALLVVAGLVGRAMLERAEDSRPTCLRPYAATYGAALSLWTAPGLAVPPELAHLHPGDLDPLEDETDAETCASLRADLPDSLRIGGLKPPWLAAFYRAGDRYVVPVVPRIDPREIRRQEEALERGVAPPTDERPSLVFVFDSTGARLNAYETW